MRTMVSVLVSGCLCGWSCRYDGSDRRHHALLEALADEDVEVVAFCPEEAAGLGTPRPRAHLDGGDGEAVLDGRARVLDEEGRDLTEAFLRGARAAVERAEERGCRAAYLKERSPSCGCALAGGRLGPVEGCGVTTALLRRGKVATISVD